MFGLGKKDKEVETTSEIGEVSNKFSADIVPVTPDPSVTGHDEERKKSVVNVSEEPKLHVCDENCQHETPPLTRREAKYLKRANYDPSDTKFNTSYVLKNKRTGQIVELRAASSFHACNIIGWKPNRVVVIDKKTFATDSQGEKEVKSIPETTVSSETNP